MPAKQFDTFHDFTTILSCIDDNLKLAGNMSDTSHRVFYIQQLQTLREALTEYGKDRHAIGCLGDKLSNVQKAKDQFIKAVEANGCATLNPMTFSRFSMLKMRLCIFVTKLRSKLFGSRSDKSPAGAGYKRHECFRFFRNPQEKGFFKLKKDLTSALAHDEQVYLKQASSRL